MICCIEKGVSRLENLKNSHENIKSVYIVILDESYVIVRMTDRMMPIYVLEKEGKFFNSIPKLVDYISNQKESYVIYHSSGADFFKGSEKRIHKLSSDELKLLEKNLLLKSTKDKLIR